MVMVNHMMNAINTVRINNCTINMINTVNNVHIVNTIIIQRIHLLS